MLIPAPAPSLLVVAPEPDLRRSLAFLLQAEGYAVETDSHWPSVCEVGHMMALVLDERGLRKDMPDDGRLSHFGNRIVLLVSHIATMPHIPLATVLRKPLLETALVDSLRALVN